MSLDDLFRLAGELRAGEVAPGNAALR